MKRYAKHLNSRAVSGSIYYRRRIPAAILQAYPKGTPMTSGADPDGAKKFDDLFGGGD